MFPPGPLDWDASTSNTAQDVPLPLPTSWVWSWADDSNPLLGRKQDCWKQYSLAFSQLLEDAIATKQTRVVVTGRETHHIDLEGWETTGIAWQVVSADPPPGRRRRVRRETAEQSLATQAR